MRSLLIGACVALALWGCGDGVICFGSNDCDKDDDADRTVTVEGNVNSVRPPNAVRNLVVFAYTGLQGAPPFSNYKHGESKVVSNDNFSIPRVSRGNITVVVLLDDPQPDGTIDCTSDNDGNITCDDCSVLRDRGKLSDVPGGRKVTIEDMDIDFDPASCPDPDSPPVPGCGCSTAYKITVARETGSGDSSSENRD